MTLSEIAEPGGQSLYWVITLRPPFRSRRTVLRRLTFDEAKSLAVKSCGPGIVVELGSSGFGYKGRGVKISRCKPVPDLLKIRNNTSFYRFMAKALGIPKTYSVQYDVREWLKKDEMIIASRIACVSNNEYSKPTH